MFFERFFGRKNKISKRVKLNTCFAKLQITYEFGKKIFELIDINKTVEILGSNENDINDVDLAEASGSATN